MVFYMPLCCERLLKNYFCLKFENKGCLNRIVRSITSAITIRVGNHIKILLYNLRREKEIFGKKDLTAKKNSILLVLDFNEFPSPNLFHKERF